MTDGGDDVVFATGGEGDFLSGGSADKHSTVLTEIGAVDLDIPQDRNGSRIGVLQRPTGDGADGVVHSFTPEEI